MSNTSATGGYLVQTEAALPDSLTLVQTVQKIVVGLTGMVNTTVRPKWQKNPPKTPPTAEDNWCAFGITETPADYAPDTEVNDSGTGSSMRTYERLVIGLSFYGPLGYENARKMRDGFKISQNRDALRAAGVGFQDVSSITNVPELHGQTWFQRSDVTLTLTREVNKTFSVLSLTGAIGTIEGQKSNDENENVPWNVSAT